MRDLDSKIKVVKHILGTVTTTQTPSAGVDLQGFDSAEVVVSIGTMTNVGGSPAESWTFALQESDSESSGFTAVSDDAVVLVGSGNNDGGVDGSGIFATVDAAAEDDAVYRIGYIGGKRYIRVVATAANTPGATAISVNMILGNPDLKPTTD